LHLIRSAAERCNNVGPDSKAIELFRKLAPASNKASDYFLLSEILTKGNFLDESIAALERAIALDPAAYDTDANRDTLKLAKSSVSPTRQESQQAQNRKVPGNERFPGQPPKTDQGPYRRQPCRREQVHRQE
jgi:tetratricopeptide (TPR) repeat protein